MKGIEDFAKRLAGDETAVSRDESRLQRDTSREDAFAAKLGMGPEQPAPDMRLAQNDMSVGPITVGPGPVAPPSSWEDMAKNAGIPARSMSDAGGQYAAPEPAGYQAPAPGETPSRFLGSRDVGGPQDPNRAPVAEGAPLASANPMAMFSGGGGQPMQSQAPPAQLIPGHHDRSLIPDTPGTIGQRQRNERDMSAAVQDEQRAIQNQNKIVGNNLQKQADDAEDRLIHRQVQEDYRQQYVQDRSAKLDKLIASTASGKEDPARIYNNADTGTKIALGLGAFFGGIIPGVGPLMKMLGGNIDADVAAQRQDKKNAQIGIDQARAGLNDVRHDFDDQRSYELAKEAQQWTNAQAQIKAQVARTDDPILKAKAQELLVASAEKITGIKQEYDRISFVRPHLVGGGAGSSAKDLNTVRLPDGRTVAFQTKEDRQKVQERVLASQDLAKIYKRVNELRTAATNTANPVELIRINSELQSLQEKALPAWSTSKGQGQVKEEEAARYKKNLFPFDSIGPSAGNIIKNGEDENAYSVENIVKAHGGEEVRPGYEYDAQGRLHPVADYVGRGDSPNALRMPKGSKPIPGTQ